MKMTCLMTRLEWKVFISSKLCRLITLPLQEFVKHTFDELLFSFNHSKIELSYKTSMPRTLGQALYRVLHRLYPGGTGDQDPGEA